MNKYIGCKLFRSFSKAASYAQTLYQIGEYECTISDVTDVVSEWHRAKRRSTTFKQTYRVDVYRKEEQ